MIKSNLMTLELWKKPLGMISICMNITKDGQLSKRLEMIRKEATWIRGRKDSIHLSSKKNYQAYQQG
jgi:hypothetical protein